MSKILISGCGLSWSRQERPTWVNVLRLCGVDIDDLAGPAISNQLILNSMIDSVLNNEYSQAICQLTATGKLDVEMTDDRQHLVDNDPIRNFTHGGFWPSSNSTSHPSKKMYYEHLYSPKLEQSDIVYKWMLLKRLCDEKGIKLHTVYGYKIDWIERGWGEQIDTDPKYTIWDDYINGEHWRHHDHSKGVNNTVPNKHFMIHLAEKINEDFLHLAVDSKLRKFRG